MSSFKMKRRVEEEKDIDITSFMNLMIVLVPVLLLSLTFTKVRVLDINLPELSGGQSAAELSQSQLDIRVDKNGFAVYFPTNTLLKKIPKTEDGGYNYLELSLVMRALKDKVADKKRRYDRCCQIRELPDTDFHHGHSEVLQNHRSSRSG